MSSNLAISVNNISKYYQIYEKPADRLKQSIWRRKKYYRDFRALEDISFQVEKGETVGIIGRNGAGKSTLLQIICGTVMPTLGKIEVNGRVAALLELGSGFNPEFTGKENIYMNAAVLGLSHREIENNYHKIVAFADIGEFVDQPIKTYSTGMQMRLAFSIAINVNPDILIVDEALAVGDMLFQAKCMIRIKQMVDQGVTVLFVSHDTSTVKSLCKRCVLLDKGKMIAFGKASEVVDIYIGQSNMDINSLLQDQVSNIDKPHGMTFNQISQSANIENEQILVSTDAEAVWPDRVHRYGDGGARILDIKLLDSNHRPVEKLEVGQEFIVQVAIRFDVDFPTFAIGYSIRDLKGQMLVGSVNTGENVAMPPVRNGEVYLVEILSRSHTRDGIYTVSVGIEFPVQLNQQHIFLDIVENAIVFENKFNPNPSTWFPALVKVPASFQWKSVKSTRNPVAYHA